MHVEFDLPDDLYDMHLEVHHTAKGATSFRALVRPQLGPFFAAEAFTAQDAVDQAVRGMPPKTLRAAPTHTFTLDLSSLKRSSP